MSKIDIKKIIIFKQGISYFISEGLMKGSGKFELEFKTDQLNDILKSLLIFDSSEKGFISSISYDAAIETSQLLKSVMLDIPDTDSFTSLIKQIKGASVDLTIGTSEKLSGIIMGIEFTEKLVKEYKISEKLLTLLSDDGKIMKIPFDEISSLNILNEYIKNDLKFYLKTVIAGKKKDLKKIVINCESGGDDEIERKIRVSYIHESPVWKVSYRIIMSKEQAKENKCLIAGFSLVENVSNIDWEDVYISLVSGMSVSFVYNFYKSIYIDRPIIQPPKTLTARPTEIEDGIGVDDFADYKKKSKKVSEKRLSRELMMKKPAAPTATTASTGFAIAGEMNQHDMMNKLASQTKVSSRDLGELFEYNILNPVSIKRKHSALVPILTEEIKAKKILLYNPNQHDKNPDACLEITNDSSFMLERGPVTILMQEMLAGEAMLPVMTPDTTRILNYAVEQAVIITHEEESENKDIHRIKIGGSYSYEYYYTNLYTTYKIKNNKSDEEKELFLDHPKKSGYKIEESPIEPEETPNYWRFKLKIKPKDAVVFKIQERKENHTSYYIHNYTKDDLLNRVTFYMRQKFISEKLESQLKEVGNIIGKKHDLEEKKNKLANERSSMTEEQSRIRANISVLGESSQESALREKYVKKFSVQEQRYENITAEIEALEKELKALNKEINEKITTLKI